MKVLIVASYNQQRFAPFIVEQAEALRHAGIEIDYFGITGKGVLGYLKARKGLMQKIGTFRPDIIHAHYGLSGLLANLQRKVPVVTTYHGSDINVLKVLRFSKIAIRLSAWNIFVSKRNVEIALGIASSNSPIEGENCTGESIKWSLLPCGVDMDNFLPRTKAEARATVGWGMEETKVLFAGAFDNAVKNAELAKAAVELLNTLADHADVRRAFIEEHELHKLKELNNDCTLYSANSCEHDRQPINSNLESNETLDSNAEHSIISFKNDTKVELVEMKGYSRAEIANLFYAVDILLMTSFTEGSPQVIKEAMACGCPIVSVDVGDVAERIAGVKHCYIAECTPEDIAAKITLVLQQGERTNGREQFLAMGLDNKQVAEKLIEIYQKILK